MPVGKREKRRFSVKRALQEFRRALKAAHDPERAKQEKRYLKSPYRFLGVKVPHLRKLAREFARSCPDATRKQVLGLAGKLWKSPFHQEKSLAIMVLEQYPQHLDGEAVPLIEEMLGQSSGWDHADWIAINLFGEVLKNDPAAKRHLIRWSGSWSLWIRRASMTGQIRLLRAGGGDRELFFRIARAMVDEKEFFIRKAIGWVVREISKTDPGATHAFLMEVRDRASGLTLREGSKRLQDKMRKEVLAKPGG
jgi:3-methyladenine DNA glycosylase AlkD